LPKIQERGRDYDDEEADPAAGEADENHNTVLATEDTKAGHGSRKQRATSPRLEIHYFYFL
jgi:hypothetical protein